MFDRKTGSPVNWVGSDETESDHRLVATQWSVEMETRLFLHRTRSIPMSWCCLSAPRSPRGVSRWIIGKQRDLPYPQIANYLFIRGSFGLIWKTEKS